MVVSCLFSLNSVKNTESEPFALNTHGKKLIIHNSNTRGENVISCHLLQSSFIPMAVHCWLNSSTENYCN